MDGGDGAPAPGGGGGGGAPPVGGGGGGGPAPLGAEAAAIVGALGAATQAIQQAIANAAANAAAAAVAAGGAGGGAPGGGGPGPFLRTPLRAGIGQQLDFSTKQGRKYYEQATRSLFSTDEKFDVEPSRFQLFINLLNTRARDLGMLEDGSNAKVPLDLAAPGANQVDLINDYGRVTLAHVTAWEQSFIAGNSRKSQDSKMLYDLIMNSLSPTGIQRIQIWKEQTQVNGLDAGGCLFKVVVRESYLDSHATVSTLRLNLSNLDKYIETNGSDIIAFNAYVQSQVDGLSSRGQASSDLIVNLFKGYKAVNDERFAAYIQQVEDGHEDGTATITAARDLMIKAVNFYKKQVTRDEWEQPTQHQKEVLALQAEVQSLKKRAPSKGTKFESKKEGPAKKSSNDKHGAPTKPEKPAWLKNNEKPKADKMHKFRTWNGTKWYWCSSETKGKCDGRWRTHKPSECRGYAAKKDSSKKKEGQKEKKTKDGALKLAAAHEALIEEQEDSDYDS